MTAPTRLILIRHAEPHEDMRGRVYGRLDVELSADGQEHAIRLAGMLAGTAVAAVYTSPSLRAVATAAPLAGSLGLHTVAVDDLRELDFGDLEGLSPAEVADRYPAVVRWTDSPSAVDFPGGESVAALRARSLRAAREIVDRHDSETVAVVSHAVVIRAIVADALAMHEDALFRIDQVYGGITVIDWFGDRPLVRVVNASHI
jgi:broad specificity phosphatase PhoE